MIFWLLMFSDDHMHLALADVQWRMQDSCRLFVNTLDLEHQLGEGNESLHLAKGLLIKLADEKAMEGR